MTLALFAAAHLAGCGGSDKPRQTPTPPSNPGGGGPGNNNGGGNGGGDPNDNPPSALAEGVFVDAPVAGLNYVTSSDISGVTDSEGRYNYNEGDTVTFSIGGLELGTVVAQGVVTPKTVAQAVTANGGDADTVAVNLLVLLQSLDADGNPENGITFTDAIRSAVDASAIDITASEGVFTSSMTNLVAAVNANPGVDITLTPVTREAAVQHFTNHSPAALAGAYVLANADFEPITQKPVTLAIFRDGRYLMGGQYDRAECNLLPGRTATNALSFSDANGNGVEHGKYTWNPLSNEFAIAEMIVETDGYCGLNKPDTESTNDVTVLEPHAKGLVFKGADDNVVYRFARLSRETETIAGAWLQPTSLLLNQPFMFTFFPSGADGTSGRYLMVDASFPDLEDDASPGIEAGCYSIDAQQRGTIELNPSLCVDAIDTTETAGLSNVDELWVDLDENGRLVIGDGEEFTAFTRLPARQITHESLAGSWIIQEDPSVALSAQEKLGMLTVFKDGRYVFGMQENDASCVPPGYPASELDEDGNGVEYGKLSLTKIPGVVVPQEVSIDSDGECGLYHNGKTDDAGQPFQQAYFIAPSDDGNALVLWPNDDENFAGVVFKRAPSEDGTVIGAWLRGADEDSVNIVAYLPGGVMFDVSTVSGRVGLLRKSFTDDGSTLTSFAAGYEHCVDSQNTPSRCLGAPSDGSVESYTIEGNTMTLRSQDKDATLIRIE